MSDTDKLVQSITGQRPGTEEERARAWEKLGPAAIRTLEEVNRKLGTIMRGDGSRRRKFIKIVEQADRFGPAIRHAVACRGAGCSHCCYESVQITRREAEKIGRHIGRDPEVLPVFADPLAQMDALRGDTARYTGLPCPFLKEEACSIYEARPVACRVAHSLADTPDPCDIRANPGQEVPRLNTNGFSMALAMLDLDQSLGDIRHYFPTADAGPGSPGSSDA